MKFFTTMVGVTYRHTEPNVHDVPTGMPIPPKHEEITLTVKMVGSGDTRKFTTGEIEAIVMDRLSEIESKAL